MASCLSADACSGARGAATADEAALSSTDKALRVCSITAIFDSCAARDPAAAGAPAPPGGGFRIISPDPPAAAAPPADDAKGSAALGTSPGKDASREAAPTPASPPPRAAPLGSGTPPEKRNLVQALRREAERLMGLTHYESAEIVLTEALTHCSEGSVYAMRAECLVKLERTQDAVGAWEAAAAVSEGDAAAHAAAQAAALRATLGTGAAAAAAPAAAAAEPAPAAAADAAPAAAA